MTEFYGLDTWEELSPDLETAMERILEDLHPEKPEFPVEILVFKRKPINESWVRCLIDNQMRYIAENLDDEYGADGHDFNWGETPELTKAFNTTVESLTQSIMQSYEPFQCVPTGERLLIFESKDAALQRLDRAKALIDDIKGQVSAGGVKHVGRIYWMIKEWEKRVSE